MGDLDGRLLARFAIDPERPHGPLAALTTDHDDLDALGPVLEALAFGPHPPAALAAATRLADAAPDAWRAVRSDLGLLERLSLLGGASSALVDLLVGSSEARDVLGGDLTAWSTHQVRADVRGRRRGDLDGSAYAWTQRLGLLRVALRDLAGLADTPTATTELTALAEGLVAAALDDVADAPACGLAVIAMGKLGGRELNYVSDIDLIFVAADDAVDDATAMARGVLERLGRITGVGRAYEVDTNLRPEGRDGPLVRSLDACAAYYDRWASTWEYQALLKARPVAGDPAVADGFIDLVTPHVWPERRASGAVEEIQRMKRVVERRANGRRGGDRQLKLAPGGLRDIEFAVQLLQLVHGRSDTTLRSPNTLEALTALAEGGYVDDGDANLISDAYQFLRTVEHRLQLWRLRRTHVIPADDAERRRLARACGFRDVRAADALAQFDRELARVRGHVRRLHEKLFYRPLLQRFAEAPAAQQRALGTGLDEDAAHDRLSALGFAAPGRAVQHLEAMVGGVSRLSRVLRYGLPAMLPALADAPDPDDGLVALRDLCQRLSADPTLLRTLRDAPPSGQLLARLLGRSRRVGDWLVRDPDLIGRLGNPAALDEPFDAVAVGGQLRALLERDDDAERIAAAIGRRLRRELVWTAVRDLSGHADVVEVSRHLADGAGLVLDAATVLARADGVDLAVIAVGKLGARELGYASDLDAVVVFDPPDGRRAALAAVERMIALVSAIAPDAPAFTLDLGLRPEGRDGALARTVDAYDRYYARWGQPWEFLALTQARPVAGDMDLARRWMSVVAPRVYLDDPPDERLAAVRRMKARVERERGGARRRGDRIDVKVGPGGLADIEWTVQLLALAHGGRHPALRVAGTRPLLDAAHDLGLLDDRAHAWLCDGWRLLTRLRNALYLIGERRSDVLPDRASTRSHVAQVLGYEAPGAQQLTEDLRRAMRRVRGVHEQVFT